SWVPPPPGTSPTVVSGRPSTAVSSATIRSQHRASSQPPPRAYPCTAAITGCGSASTLANAARNTSRWASSPASDSRLRSFRSAPTEKARSPAADSTTTRESLSEASSAQAWASRVAMAVSIAFSASGRSRMISQTPACPARWGCIVMPSMPPAYGGRSGSGLLPGQPGVLVLDQLEQGGLHLLDLRDLGQDELPVLAGRFDHELAAAEQPVDQPVRERDVADPDQREVAAGTGQDALAQPEAAGGELVGGGLPAQERDTEPDHRHHHGQRADRDPARARVGTRRDHQQHHPRRGRDNQQDEGRPQEDLPVRVEEEDGVLPLG